MQREIVETLSLIETPLEDNSSIELVLESDEEQEEVDVTTIVETVTEEEIGVVEVTMPKEEITLDRKPLEEPKIKVVKVKKNKKEKVPKIDNSIVRIRDAFASEVEIMSGCIYVEANKVGTQAAMKAYDIFENMVEQNVNNKNALERFERLVIKFSRDKSIGLFYNEDRFSRYLKKEKK